MARQNRTSKTGAERARVVVDEDSSLNIKSPFPTLAMSGLDNTDEVIKSMEAYRLTHSLQETEAALHGWFDEYDAILERAINEQNMIKDRRISRSAGADYSSLDRTTDYRQMEQRRMAERRADNDDRRRYETDGLACARIQQAFTKVRNYLVSKNIKYEWFKIRFGNGNGSW